MRISLIQTPVEDFYYTPQRTYPLGLTYLATAVKDLPVEVEIIDFITGHGRQTIPVPMNFKPIMDYLPYDRSPISAFHSYYHHGANWHHIEEFFKTNQFDLYAISSNFYTYSQEVIKTAEIIKRSNPSSIIVVGGQNVGSEHSLFTNCPDIDYCIHGEGDIAFRDFVKTLINKKELSRIPGIFNRTPKHWNDPAIIHKFDIKPSSALLPVNKYQISGEPAMMLATSRGCPVGCRFCSVSRTFGQNLRLKPVDIVLEEIRSAYDRDIRAFDIEDDNFTFIREHCIELLQKISEKYKGKIALYAMNGLSAEHLNEEIVDLLYNCGMRLLNLSIATSSEEQLKKLHRKTSIEHFKQVSKYAASKGMKVMGHFIAGLPDQSPTEILKTMKVLNELPVVLGISPFYYIPGMKMEVSNKPVNCKDARLSRFWPADKHLDELDLITLFRLSRWINYLKARMQEHAMHSIHFAEIRDVFQDDIYFQGLINDRSLIGMNSKNKYYRHHVSDRILDSFFGIFKDSDVYCA